MEKEKGFNEVLQNMTLAELKAHQHDVEKRIVEYAEQQKDEIARKIRELLAEANLNLHDVIDRLEAGKRRKPTVSGPAKYVHPTDPSKTWTGRGRRPGWVNELNVAPAQEENGPDSTPDVQKTGAAEQ